MQEVILFAILLGSIIYVVKDLVQNLVLGLFIKLHPYLGVGDVITVAGIKGKIKRIGVKWTVLESNGKEFLIENELIFRQIIQKEKRE